MAGLLDDQQRYRDALAQYLVSEKDTRPYWETDHRGMVLPLVKSGYNNSVSYGVPGIAGGSAWGVLNDIISGRQVDKGEIEQGASDAAGAAMTGGFALGSSPQNSVGMFAGRQAKTADHAALAKAEELAASGAPREQIWKDTGWFQGVDGKWRFEIDDSAARVRDLGYGKLPEKLDHAPLIDAYPDMANVGASLSKGGNFGVSFADMIAASGRNPDGIKKTALHELQHQTQAREGFNTGGDPFSGVTMHRIPFTNQEIANPLQWLSSYRNYKRGAGETEARTVEARANLTPEERAARPPWLDYDVPEAQQIVRFNNEGPALSRPSGSIGSGGLRAAEDPSTTIKVRSLPWSQEYTATKGKGYVEASRPIDGTDLRVYASSNGGEAGTGLSMYRALIDEANRKGLSFTSDKTVSPSAQHIYDALRRRGHRVDVNPDTRTTVDGVLKSDAGPIFDVGPSPWATYANAPTSAASPLINYLLQYDERNR